MKLKEHIRSFVPILASEAGALPKEMQIMPFGEWHSPTHGEVVVNKTVCQQMIDNFNSSLRAGDSLPIDIDHAGAYGNTEAAGWITSLYMKEGQEDASHNGLWGATDWSDLGEEKITGKRYKFFSPEWAPNWQSPQDGKTYSNVLIGGGLVNRPFFKDMKPVTFSENGGVKTDIIVFVETNPNQEPMNIQDILAKAEADRTQEEKDFVASQEQPAPDAPPVVPPVEPPVTPVDPPTPPADPTPTDPTLASEKNVTITASELTALKTAAEQGALAFKELERKECSEKVSGLLMSESNKAGKILPREKDKVTKFYQELSKDQREQFLDIMATAIPSPKLFGEIGTSEPAAGEAVNALDAQIKELSKSESITYSEAMKRVYADEKNKGLLEEKRRAEVASHNQN